jgi:hypothetical protein
MPPVILASSQHELMQATIAQLAREERVGPFSRFSVMRRSVEAGLPPSALVAWDGLHHSAVDYEPWPGPSMRRGTDPVAIGQQGGILREVASPRLATPPPGGYRTDFPERRLLSAGLQPALGDRRHAPVYCRF